MNEADILWRQIEARIVTMVRAELYRTRATPGSGAAVWNQYGLITGSADLTTGVPALTSLPTPLPADLGHMAYYIPAKMLVAVTYTGSEYVWASAQDFAQTGITTPQGVPVPGYGQIRGAIRTHLTASNNILVTRYVVGGWMSGVNDSANYVEIIAGTGGSAWTWKSYEHIISTLSGVQTLYADLADLNYATQGRIWQHTINAIGTPGTAYLTSTIYYKLIYA